MGAFTYLWHYKNCVCINLCSSEIKTKIKTNILGWYILTHLAVHDFIVYKWNISGMTFNLASPRWGWVSFWVWFLLRILSLLFLATVISGLSIRVKFIFMMITVSLLCDHWCSLIALIQLKWTDYWVICNWNSDSNKKSIKIVMLRCRCQNNNYFYKKRGSKWCNIIGISNYFLK